MSRGSLPGRGEVAVSGPARAMVCEGSPTPGSDPLLLDRMGRPEPYQSPGAVAVGLPSTGQDDGSSSGYLEAVAKRSADLRWTLEKQCPGYWLMGTCENGHRFAKELYCGREWCPVCGEDWSPAHQRRFARWLRKAVQIESMGYFVFTIPEALRSNFRTRKAIKGLEHHIQDLMKAHGYSRGLRRWHYFGDKSTRYHPHLNVIVDAGFIPEAKLDTIKKVYAVLLGVDVVDIHYQYVRSPAEKVHVLKYVTRATFRDYRWDPRMAVELSPKFVPVTQPDGSFGWKRSVFRNQLWWGWKQWDREPCWSLADLQGDQAITQDLDPWAIECLDREDPICPRCSKPIAWSRPFPIAFLDAGAKRSLGAGYYELEPVRGPPGLDPEIAWRLQMIKMVRQAELAVARARWEKKYLADLAEDYEADQGILLREDEDT